MWARGRHIWSRSTATRPPLAAQGESSPPSPRPAVPGLQNAPCTHGTGLPACPHRCRALCQIRVEDDQARAPVPRERLCRRTGYTCIHRPPGTWPSPSITSEDLIGCQFRGGPTRCPAPPPPRPPVAQIAPAAMSCGSRSRVHPSRSRVVEVAGAPGAAALARRMAAGGAEAGCVGEHGLPAEAELQREVGP